jgi:hypothetical protein
MAEEEEQHPSPKQLAELSALADGSIDPTRRHAVEQWIARSPHLRALYERERASVELLGLAAAERAPTQLRWRLEGQRPHVAAWPRWNPAYAVLAGALAAAIAAVAFGTPGSPSVSQAAQLALRGPSAPAPAVDPSDPRIKLIRRLQGLYFPNWSGKLGWRPAGVRSDLLGGREAVTVYYQRRGMTVAYTIVAAPALEQPPTPVMHLGAFALQTFNLSGRSVVTWRRAGHTCVISASGVPTRVLERLADWQAARITD